MTIRSSTKKAVQTATATPLRRVIAVVGTLAVALYISTAGTVTFIRSTHELRMNSGTQAIARCNGPDIVGSTSTPSDMVLTCDTEPDTTSTSTTTIPPTTTSTTAPTTTASTTTTTTAPTTTTTTPPGAPTLVSFEACAFNSSTSPKAPGALTVNAGDIVVVAGVSEDHTTTVAPSNSGGLTWTQQTVANVTGNTYLTMATDILSSGGTVTPSFTSTGSGDWGCGVWLVRGGTAVGATLSARGSGAPSSSITPQQNNSLILQAVGDWAAVSGTNTWLGSGVDDTDATVAGRYSTHLGHVTTATTSPVNLGMSSPTGQTWTLQGVEITSVGGGGSTTTTTAPTTTTTSPGGNCVPFSNTNRSANDTCMAALTQPVLQNPSGSFPYTSCSAPCQVIGSPSAPTTYILKGDLSDAIVFGCIYVQANNITLTNVEVLDGWGGQSPYDGSKWTTCGNGGAVGVLSSGNPSAGGVSVTGMVTNHVYVDGGNALGNNKDGSPDDAIVCSGCTLNFTHAAGTGHIVHNDGTMDLENSLIDGGHYGTCYAADDRPGLSPQPFPNSGPSAQQAQHMNGIYADTISNMTAHNTMVWLPCTYSVTAGISINDTYCPPATVYTINVSLDHDYIEADNNYSLDGGGHPPANPCKMSGPVAVTNNVIVQPPIAGSVSLGHMPWITPGGTFVDAGNVDQGGHTVSVVAPFQDSKTSFPLGDVVAGLLVAGAGALVVVNRRKTAKQGAS